MIFKYYTNIFSPKMMLFYIFCILSIGYSFHTLAQSESGIYASIHKGTIKGRVIDRAGLAVVGVNVWLKGTSRGTSTNSEGSFEIHNVREGKYTVIVSAVNVKSVEQSVTIQAGEKLTLDFVISENITELVEVQVIAKKMSEITPMQEIEGMGIFAGKKTEVINLDKLDANLATNNVRQIFAKTAGISVWENDGSGIQINVAARGLSPNRSWEFNVRQNGYDISSDVFGYPEAYYNPSMEAVENIKIVRGAASLQYGAQFGGLLNYVLKKGNTQKPFSFETQQTVGSYGLFGTYNAIGGTKGRWNYYAYYQHRNADGWRENSKYSVDNMFFNVNYAFTNRLKLGIEYTHSTYTAQQAGGLTDVQFAQNPRQSVRARNWFNVPWNVANLTLDYQIKEKTKLNLKVFGLIGDRNSIGYIRGINIPDTINLQTQQYNARQIDRDRYVNWGAELRLLADYSLFGMKNTIASGLRYFIGNSTRNQLGIGNTGTDFNLNLQNNTLFPRSLSFGTANFAAFAENIFRLTHHFSLTAGVRYEFLANQSSGRLNLKNDGNEDKFTPLAQNRNIILFGLGAEYKTTATTSLYANFSQAYRPILFSELTPAATTNFEIDPTLKDAFGHNIDLGYRGNIHDFLTFDVGVFYLRYNNRIGNLTLLDAQNKSYQLRTNVGNSISQGIESYIEFDPVRALRYESRWGYVSLFGSFSFINAKYDDFRTTSLVNGQVAENNLQNKHIENAPAYIHRFGANYVNRGLSITWQMSIVSDVYTDAINTELPTPNAQTGKVDGYQVMDLSATYRFLKHYHIKASINNLTDTHYATRRSGGYPGPGLLPNEGRTFYLSVGMKL